MATFGHRRLSVRSWFLVRPLTRIHPQAASALCNPGPIIPNSTQPGLIYVPRDRLVMGQGSCHFKLKSIRLLDFIQLISIKQQYGIYIFFDDNSAPIWAFNADNFRDYSSIFLFHVLLQAWRAKYLFGSL